MRETMCPVHSFISSIVESYNNGVYDIFNEIFIFINTHINHALGIAVSTVIIRE